MATTIQDNVNNYYFKNQADFETHKTEIPNNSTIYIEETGEVNVTINGTETENIEDLNNIIVGDKTYKVAGGGTSISTLNYSTEEQYTGKRWIDGKKIYEKTIILENLSTGTTNITLTGVDTLVSKQSIFKRKDGSQYATNIQTNLSSGWSIYFNDFINGKLELVIGANFSGNYQIIKAFITVQYTKTTE